MSRPSQRKTQQELEKDIPVRQRLALFQANANGRGDTRGGRGSGRGGTGTRGGGGVGVAGRRLGEVKTSQDGQRHEDTSFFQPSKSALKRQHPPTAQPSTSALGGSSVPEPSQESELHSYSHACYCDSLFSALQALHEEGLLIDCDLELHHNPFRCHWVVLAAVSQRAEMWLKAGKAGMKKAIEDLSQGHVSIIGLRAVLRFAYGHEVVREVQEAGTLEEVMTACSHLGVTRLAQVCQGKATLNETKEREQSLDIIRRLWMNGTGCDVFLQSDSGETFPAHRVVLAAGSDYFRALFCGGLRESGQDTICLHGISATVLRPLLQFLYSGKLLLGWACVFDMAEAALQFQLQGALLLCLTFFKERMDAGTCLDVLAMAEAYGLKELGEATEDYILAHFQKVAAGEKFQDLSLAQLETLLVRDALSVESEIVVFRALLFWIEDDREGRLPHLAHLLRAVRIPLMTPSELREVQTCGLLRQSRGGRAMLEEVGDILEGNQPILDCRPRTANQVLVLVGGDCVDEELARREPNFSLWVARRFLSGPGLIRTVEWRSLAQLPEPARFRHCVCVLQNKLYVIGGRKYYGVLDILKSALRFDPALGSWERLPDMASARDYFAAVCADGKVFVLGGSVDDTHYLSSVEYFTPEDNTWRQAHPLDMALCGLAAAVWDGEIFVSGGCDTSLRCLPFLWHYHPKRGCSQRAPMLAGSGRAGHVMLPTPTGLVVVGGLQPSWSGCHSDQLRCELYCPSRNTWTPFAVLPRPHLFPAGTALDGQLYVLGGTSADTARDTAWVHRYDPRDGCWNKLGAMPRPYADLCACTLKLPPGTLL